MAAAFARVALAQGDAQVRGQLVRVEHAAEDAAGRRATIGRELHADGRVVDDELRPVHGVDGERQGNGASDSTTNVSFVTCASSQPTRGLSSAAPSTHSPSACHVSLAPAET